MKTWTIRIIAISLILISGFFVLQRVLALQGSDPTQNEMYQETVATIEVSGGRLVFHPIVDYEIAGIRLVVSGPNGFRWDGEFGGEDLPTFALVDEAGNALPDGSYQYGLQAYPLVGPEAQAAFAEAVDTRDPKVVEELQAKGLLPTGPFAQEGVFVLVNGVYSVGENEQSEVPSAPDDNVINDDLIVIGNACIGSDCVNNEPFGPLDTLWLKETNIRLTFIDTSVGAFPTTDWEIEVNSGASGGNSYMAFQNITDGTYPFYIGGGTPNYSLYVEDGTGDVGLGTSMPEVELQIADGDTPLVRLEQNGNSGFTPQTWDVAGNETNFFIRDVTNGSKIPFVIRPGAPDNSLRIDINGDVGLGTNNPDYTTEIYRTDASAFLGVTTNYLGVVQSAILGVENEIVQVGAATTTTVEIISGGQPIATFDSDGNLTLNGLLTEASDRNLKENFASVDSQDVLEKIASLPVTTWNYKGQSETHMGPVAQDFSTAFGLGTDDKHIAPLDVNGVTLAGVQALYQQLQEKDAQISELETRLSTLESQSGVPQSAAPTAPWLSVLAGLLGAAAFSLLQKFFSSKLAFRHQTWKS